jgi:hypothetical protein
MSTPGASLESDRLTYPALLPPEIAVWRAWLRLHQAEYDRFDYNARVGPGFDPGPAAPDYVRTAAIAITRKRIDAVAWQGNTPLIIEVKTRAGFSAIGQLVGYLVHWRLEHANAPDPRMLLVAGRLAPGVEDVLKHLNIPHELVTG